MSVLWQKNGEQPVEWFMAFTTGKDRQFDRRLLFEDLLTNMAQVAQLKETGIVTVAEADALLPALRLLWKEAENGTFSVQDSDEDVHSAVEKRLEKMTGAVAGKIHTGRSRNDQVMCDIRLYLKKIEPELVDGIAVLAEKMANFALRNNGKPIPGYTHTRPAMPSSADAWMEGWLDILFSLLSSLQHDCAKFDRLPLGSAAGYGVPEIPVNRPLLAKLLGFSSVQEPVTAVQLSRGMDELALVDTIGYLTLMFGRMAADVIVFSDGPDAAFVLSPDQTSGSSIMPQKKNPDVWELIRAAASDFQGFRARLVTIQANQRSGYHRDFQVVKEIVIDALDHFQQLLPVVGFGIDGISVNEQQKPLDSALLATQVANALVANNEIPFREAYRRVGADPSSYKEQTFRGFSTYRHSGAPGQFNAPVWAGKIADLKVQAGEKKAIRKDAESRLLNGSVTDILSSIPL